MIALMVLFVGVGFGAADIFFFNPLQEAPKWPFVVRIVFAHILFATIQYALKAQHSLSLLRLEKEQIQTENYRAQLKVLRAQIDPHFLFNSLNTLRSMVRQQHTHSEQFIITLSDFYRQTLNQNHNPTLKLEEELLLLNSYLFLMKSRNEKAISTRVNIDPAVLGKYLPSMALQIVVENCFKHNSMSSKRPLEIEVSNPDEFHIRVQNTLRPRIGGLPASGYGLNLLQKRYELMGISGGLEADKTDTYFRVDLKLIEG